MIFNEIKFHANTSLGLVAGGCRGCIPPCVRACSSAIRFLFFDVTCYIVEMYSHIRACFQISSKCLVQNLSVWEIYLC